MSLRIPERIRINDRLYNDIMLMHEYTVNSDIESGGFLIRGLHGNIGVVGVQRGENREIVFNINEHLHEGERALGTFHAHPITHTFSIGDVKSFLMDDIEYVMMNTGVNGEVNVAVKIPNMTISLDAEAAEELEQFEQEDLPEIADVFQFLYYQGDGKRLTLQNPDRERKVLFGKYLVSDEEITLEELIDRLEIKGIPRLPEDYGIKKLWPAMSMGVLPVSYEKGVAYPYGLSLADTGAPLKPKDIRKIVKQPLRMRPRFFEESAGYEIQTLIFDKDAFPTRQSALDWAEEHGFKHYTIRETTNTWRVRQFPPERCKGSGFTKQLSPGVKAYFCKMK